MQKQSELTVNDLCFLFGVTVMTVNNWRKGSTRIPPLPFKSIPTGKSNRIVFRPTDVAKWAKDNDMKPVTPLKNVFPKRTK